MHETTDCTDDTDEMVISIREIRAIRGCSNLSYYFKRILTLPELMFSTVITIL